MNTLLWVVLFALLGLAVVASLWLSPGLGAMLVAGYIFMVMLAVVLRRPQWALLIFIVALPLHNLSMAFLLAQTGSVGFVKLIQPWKEVLVAIALARVLGPLAYRTLRRRPVAPGLRLTPLDVVVALFVLLAAISVVLPNHLIPLTGRLYGFRDLVMPLAVYALGRLAAPTRRELKAIVALIGLDVAAFATVAIGERAIWGNDVLLAVDYGHYIKVIFGSTFPTPHNTPWTFYTAGYLPRAGSLALGPLDVSILMLIALPILLVAASARAQFARRWAEVALPILAALGGAGLVLAWGRESLVLVLLEFALVLAFARPRWQWKGVAMALGGGIGGGILLLSVAAFVIQAPSDAARIHAANTGLARLIALEETGQAARPYGTGANELLRQSASGRNPSTVGHLQSLVKLTGLIVRHPQGYGIGTSGQVGTRFSNAGFAGETSYLSVGAELGVLGMLLYLALFAGAIFACWRAVRSRLPLLERTVLLGVAIAWLAIFLDGIFTEVTLNIFAMYFLFWMAGGAVTLVQQSRVVLAPAGARAPLAAARPLRVAMDAQSLRTARTGIRTYVDELLLQFARPGQPHQVVPLAGPPRLSATNRIYRILNQMVAVPWLHVWLPIRLWLGNYDVLFSPEYLTPAWTPIPRVVTFHDAMFLRRPQDYNPLWLALFRHVSLPALRRSDAIIVVAEYGAEDTAARARLRRERIHVVPNGGPRPTEASAASAGAIAQYGVQPGQYVLHVGVLERRKNLVTLVRAFALWRQQGAPDGFKLVLAGQPGPRPDMDDSRAIRDAIAELHLGEQVVLTGHISSEDRDALYRQAGVVAIPSIMEGFGLPVLEAFAAGVPVVAARATSLPEVAGDGALFFDPEQPQELANCLARAVTDPEQRAALVRAGAARLPQFTWERCARGTSGVFEAAVLRAYAPGLPPTVDGEGRVVWRD